MTNGQIQQLQDLSKCYMTRGAAEWVSVILRAYRWDDKYRLTCFSKHYPRQLTHKYRNQIRAIKRNQRANA